MVSWKYQCRRCPSEGAYTARKTLCMKTRSRKIGPYRKVDIPCGTVRKQRDDIGKPRATYDNSRRKRGYHPRGRYHKVETWKRQNWWTQGEGWAVNIFRHFSYAVNRNENEEPFNATYLKLKTQRERLDLFQDRYVKIMERKPPNPRLLQEALKLVFYLAYSNQRVLAVDKKTGHRITKKAVQKYGLLGRASLGHDTVYKNERDFQDMEETLTEEMPVFDIANHATVEHKIKEFLEKNHLPRLRQIEIPNFENSTKDFGAMKIHFLHSYEEIRRNLDRKIGQADEEAVPHIINTAKRDLYAVLQPYLKFLRVFEANVQLSECLPLLVALENFFVQDFDPNVSLQEGVTPNRFRTQLFPGILKNVEKIVGIVNERIERSGKLGTKRDTRRTTLEANYERQLNQALSGTTKKAQKEREKLLKAYMTRVDIEEIQKVGLVRYEDRYVEENDNETDEGLLKSCKYLLKLYYELFSNSFEMVTDLKLPPQKESVGDRWLTAYPEEDVDDAEFQKRVKRRDRTRHKTQEEVDREQEKKRERYEHKLKKFKNSQTNAPLEGVNTTDAEFEVPESGLSKDEKLNLYQRALKKPKHVRKALANRTKRREKQYAQDEISVVWELEGTGDYVLDKPSKDKSHKKYFLTEEESTELKEIKDMKERRAAIKKLIQKKKKKNKKDMESSDSDEDFAPPEQIVPEPKQVAEI